MPCHPQTILAYGMNGKPLPVANGAPLRLRVERQLGYKMAKYVHAIELVRSFSEIGSGLWRLLGRPRLRLVRRDLIRDPQPLPQTRLCPGGAVSIPVDEAERRAACVGPLQQRRRRYVLTGCVVEATGPQALKPAPSRMAVSGGAVVIGGPQGYCVDSGASRDGQDAAFVLLGSCASISGSFNALRPKKPGVLTASVASGQTDAETFAASFPSMARFLGSPAGRAALSRDGRAQSVTILQIASAGGVMYIHAQDRADAPGQDVDPDYWRALMAVNGRIVTLSVLALRDMPLTPEAKRSLLEGFVARVRALNSSGAG